MNQTNRISAFRTYMAAAMAGGKAPAYAERSAMEALEVEDAFRIKTLVEGLTLSVCILLDKMIASNRRGGVTHADGMTMHWGPAAPVDDRETGETEVSIQCQYGIDPIWEELHRVLTSAGFTSISWPSVNGKPVGFVTAIFAEPIRLRKEA